MILTSKKDKSLAISDHINTHKSDNHTRIKGTKISVVIPEAYSYDKEQARYQKDDNAFFEIMDNHFVSFGKAKRKAGLLFSGRKVKLNQFDAVISVKPSESSGKSGLVFLFGNKSFYVSIVAEYETNDEKTERELINIVQSIYYDDSYHFDPLDSANFSFDESITGFQFTERESNFLVYFEEGKNSKDLYAANYHIGSLPLMTYQMARDYFGILLQGYSEIGIFLKDKKIEIAFTYIGQYSVMLLEEPIVRYEKEGGIYMALLTGEDSSVFLSGASYEHVNSNLDKFQDTVKSVVIKNIDTLISHE